MMWQWLDDEWLRRRTCDQQVTGSIPGRGIATLDRSFIHVPSASEVTTVRRQRNVINLNLV